MNYACLVDKAVEEYLKNYDETQDSDLYCGFLDGYNIGLEHAIKWLKDKLEERVGYYGVYEETYVFLPHCHSIIEVVNTFKENFEL